MLSHNVHDSVARTRNYLVLFHACRGNNRGGSDVRMRGSKGGVVNVIQSGVHAVLAMLLAPPYANDDGADENDTTNARAHDDTNGNAGG
ncbi:hypothetical protein MT325_m685R [Paramecium bursaria chlorella virus MT325]|uniref:Uncharacterized protein m685R n=1 Tax=Paramecium bursaria Chlorella virus MT325 TaxID=346932 RepID=A7IV65_PBCVM|nr:hypothetical protein MT325_m685R [Paramecium bursaria chlorella virus MT325]